MRSLVACLSIIGVCFVTQASWAQGVVSRLLVEDTEFNDWEPNDPAHGGLGCYVVPTPAVGWAACGGGEVLTGSNTFYSDCDNYWLDCEGMQIFMILGATVPDEDAYSPETTGTLNSVTGEFRVRHNGIEYWSKDDFPPDPLDTHHEAHLLIDQDGTFYISSDSVTVSSDGTDPGDWETFGPLTLEAGDFVELASADIEDVIPGSHPNFFGAGSGEPTLGEDILFGVAIDLEWHGTLFRGENNRWPSMARKFLVDDFTITVNINDEDDDGAPDGEDNCLLLANQGGAGEPGNCDSDGDGYGNACDGDFNDDCVVAVDDFSTLAGWYGSYAPPAPLDVDMTCNGAVDGADYGLLAAGYGNPPGPSGLPGPLPCDE